MDKLLTIGDRIKIKRKEIGYTQEALAELTEIARASIGQIESGHIMPSLQFLSRFIRICNTSYSYIIDGEESTSTKPYPSERSSIPNYSEMMKIIRQAQKSCNKETGEHLEALFDGIIDENMSLKNKLISFHESKNSLIEKIKKKL